MQLPRIRATVPTGLSFAIPDLVVLRGWSDFHGLRMAIELDVRTGDDEYEERLGLYDPSFGFRRWIIWRSDDGIVVKPAIGHAMLFDCMTEALERLIPPRD